MYIVSDEDFGKLSEVWMKTSSSTLEIQHLLMQQAGVTKVQSVRLLTAFSDNGAIEIFLGRMIVIKKGLVLFQAGSDSYATECALCGGIMQQGEGRLLLKTRCFYYSSVGLEIFRLNHALRVTWGIDQGHDSWGGSGFFPDTRWVELNQWLNQWLPREEEKKPLTKSSR